MAQSPTGGTLQVRIAGVNEPVLADIYFSQHGFIYSCDANL